MAIQVRVSKEEQQRAILHVSQTFETYKKLLKDYRDRMLDIYKEYTTFTQPKTADWKTTFKVNKAHEVVNKVSPRIMSKNPKWLVSSKPEMIKEAFKMETDEEKVKKINQLQTEAKAVQELLTQTFEKHNLVEPSRLWGKSMVIYGNSFARVKFKYEVGTTTNAVDKTNTYIDPDTGEEVIEKIDKETSEYVYGEYPTIETTSWTNIYYDPRYKVFSDVPAVIEVMENVRFAEIQRNKKKYINVDKLKEIIDSCGGINWGSDGKDYKKRVLEITGLTAINMAAPVDKENLTLKIYYGYYTLEGSEYEKLYKITTVNDILNICFEEISQNPFELLRCFEDTDTLLSWGFVEPMLGIQKEMNFKKNSVSEYINQGLNRTFVRNPNSGINPGDLISKPGGIIPTSKKKDEVDQNFWELPMRTIAPDYFQEQNDEERQIQAATFTVDTSNPNNQQSLTNTATGARIKFFESNVVMDDVRQRHEQGMVRIAYKLLTEIFDNMDDNLFIEKEDGSGYLEINKELIKDALKKYQIRIEVGSASYDSIDQRREDALAKYNLGVTAKDKGVNVDMEKLFKNVMNTFEDEEDYIIDTSQQQALNGIVGGLPSTGMGGKVEMPAPVASDAAAVTEQVAKGGVATGL